MLGHLARGLDMQEVGLAMGVSKQRIGQIVKALEGKDALVRGNDGSITITIRRQP